MNTDRDQGFRWLTILDGRSCTLSCHICVHPRSSAVARSSSFSRAGRRVRCGIRRMRSASHAFRKTPRPGRGRCTTSGSKNLSRGRSARCDQQLVPMPPLHRFADSHASKLPRRSIVPRSLQYGRAADNRAVQFCDDMMRGRLSHLHQNAPARGKPPQKSRGGDQESPPRLRFELSPDQSRLQESASLVRLHFLNFSSDCSSSTFMSPSAFLTACCSVSTALSTLPCRK